jgi:radical SAM protein with 4Fe4S-binding SPASM domain
MEREARALPLVLRRETFGGILFDPQRGTHLELDAEAFELLADWISWGRQAWTVDEKALMAQLRAEIPALARGPVGFRLVPNLAGRVRPRVNATVLGSPTLVDLQITRRCLMGCPHCYASSHPSGEDMPLDVALGVLDEVAEAGVCQLAIGGGEPLLHPHIVEVLRHARRRGLVPNLTTTGDGMTPDTLDALAECCGAVALSLEGVGEDFDRRRRGGFAAFQSVHETLRARGVPVVFQVTLSVENLPALSSIVDHAMSFPDLYGVIFLAYKSVGRGRGYQTPLSGVSSEELFPRLRDAFMRLGRQTRVGYDCCLTPGIVGMDAELGFADPNLLEGCSAARTSVGVTTGLDVVPCTFLTHRPLGNLAEKSFVEIWHGEAAEGFRRELDGTVDRKPECRDCRSRTSCLGGCPEWNLVECHVARR